MARIFSAEEIFTLFFHHVFQKHAAQFRHRTLLIPDPEEAVDVAKLMELVSCPTLELFFGQATA
jgi:hypothetical protein